MSRPGSTESEVKLEQVQYERGFATTKDYPSSCNHPLFGDSGNEMETVDCLVVGGGITGSTLAFYLNRGGVDVLLTETMEDTGGKIISSKNAEGFVWEEGANTFRPNTYLMRALVDLGLREELVLANPSLPRFIYWDGELHRLPMSPMDLIRDFRLLSYSGILRAGLGAIGLVTRPPPPEADESVKDFMTRHLGQEVFEKLVDPFVSGVYAGDPDKLAMRSVLNDVYALETLGGPGLIGGALCKFVQRAREEKNLCESSLRATELPKCPSGSLGSFKQGLQTFPRAAAKFLGDSNVRTGWTLLSVTKCNNLDVTADQLGKCLYNCTFETPSGSHHNVKARYVALTVPAYHLKDVTGLKELVPEVERLNDISYPPVASVALAYPTEAFRFPLKGFGNLLPRKMNIRTLGMIWSSSIFPGRTPEGYETIVCFIGGATDPSIVGMKTDEIISQVHSDVKHILLHKDYTPPPKVLGCRLWPAAIPQYNKGHYDIMEALESGLKRTPGLELSGNYRTGVAIGDCIEYGYKQAEVIKEFLNRGGGGCN